MGSERLIPAIVLAAGMSRRMEGLFKPLLPVGGKAMIRRVVETLREARGIGEIILVTGHRAEEVERAAGGGARVRIVFNPEYETGGMVSSVQCGVRELPAGVAGFVLSLGDQPMVRAETIGEVVERWREGQIAIPTYEGKRGHPVVLSGDCIGEILGLESTQTLKTVIARKEERIVEVVVGDEGVVMDIDTPKDYEQMLGKWTVEK